MGKTQKTVSIPVSNACHAALLECRNRSVVAELVFVNDVGRPISWSSYRRYFSIAKDIAGIDRRLRFHDLRHSYASRLVSRHVPLKTVSEVLGHSTVRMTERYARPSEEAKRIIKSALDDDG